NAVGLKVGETIFEPGKCERCGNTGYRGRVGVFEVLQVTEEVRHLINVQTDSVSIDKAAIQAGMTTMIEDGVAKCRAGVTSPAEILRVTTTRERDAEFSLSSADRAPEARKRIDFRPDCRGSRPSNRISWSRSD